MNNVAVIGGGWSGLSAAITLGKAGVRCTLFESARQLGGRARRVVVDGEPLDNGQHILLGAYSESLRLLSLVHPGFNEASVLLRTCLSVYRPNGIDFRARKLPAPLHLIVGLARAGGITLKQRMAALKFFSRLRLRRFRVDSDLTVAELIEEQPHILQKQLWEPLCLAALNTLPQQASAQVFLNVLRRALGGSRQDSDLLLPCVDLGALLPDAASQFIQAHGGTIRLGEGAQIASSLDGYGFEIDLPGGQESFSHVICAVAPQQFGRVTAALPMLLPVRKAIDRFSYNRIATVYLCFDRSPELAQPMLQLDGNPGQWLFNRRQLGSSRGILAVVISAAEDTLGVDQSELNRLVLEQLRRIWPDWPRPRWIKAIVEKKATFVCRANMVRPEAGRLMRGFYLAGDYADPELPATIESAAVSGVRAAEALIADLAGELPQADVRNSSKPGKSGLRT